MNQPLRPMPRCCRFLSSLVTTSPFLALYFFTHPYELAPFKSISESQKLLTYVIHLIFFPTLSTAGLVFFRFYWFFSICSWRSRSIIATHSPLVFLKCNLRWHRIISFEFIAMSFFVYWRKRKPASTCVRPEFREKTFAAAARVLTTTVEFQHSRY